jgi:hypothetical protein
MRNDPLLCSGVAQDFSRRGGTQGAMRLLKMTKHFLPPTIALLAFLLADQVLIRAGKTGVFSRMSALIGSRGLPPQL